MAQVKIFGYTDRISVRPGDPIRFFVSADGTTNAEAQLVRLVHGDQHPDGPGFIEREFDCDENGTWEVRKQFTQVGSFLKVDDPNGHLRLDDSFTLFAYIHPTVPKWGTRQAVLGRWDITTNNGYGLGITQDGYLEFWVGDGQEMDYVRSEVPLMGNQWYFVAVTYDRKSGEATLHQSGVANRYANRLGPAAPVDFESHVRETFRFSPEHLDDTPFVMAGSRDHHALRGHFWRRPIAGRLTVLVCMNVFWIKTNWPPFNLVNSHHRKALLPTGIPRLVTATMV